ncbi:MAG: cobalt ECF transporter T component CbiQ [Phycisphaeraceae bacterium]
MYADFLDRYSRLDSPVHRLPASFKLLMAMAGVVFIIALPPVVPVYFGVLPGAALALVGVAAISRIPASFLLRRLLWLEPLVIGVLALHLFQPGGWRVFVFLAAKCTLCLFTMILLANTTPFSELLRVLQRLHLPSLLMTTLSLMYRYLFVLIDESARMRRARASRTFALSRRRDWRNAATVISQLFIRASERAERIYIAMCARGWP